jgi:hypothetical protein
MRSNFNSRAKKPYVNLGALQWALAQEQFEAGKSRRLLEFFGRKSDEYGCCFYAQRTIGEELGLSDRCVRNYLKPLKDQGLVRVVKRTRGGLRATNVYQLIGWPDRNQLPESGHPIAGRYVVETPTSLEQLFLKRNRLPHHAENGAALNQYTEKNTTMDEEKEGVLYICIEELGPWATEKNVRALTRSSETLFELLERGFDLHRHVLPTIKSMVRSRARSPILKSWTYFADAIASFAEKNPLPKKCETQTDHHVAVSGKSSFETESQFEKRPGNYSVDYLRALAERRRFGSSQGGRS